MGIAYRYFGFLSFGEGDGLRFTWLAVVRRWGIGLELSNRGADRDGHAWWLRLHLIAVCFLIALPLPLREAREKDGFGDSWGFTWNWDREDIGTLHWSWFRGHCIWLPWSWQWHRTSYLLRDGRHWASELAGLRGSTVQLGSYLFLRDELPIWQETHDYTYMLKSGTVQHRKATISVEEREWRLRWLMWLAWPRRISRCINVEFNGEVGERTGSWKGGTVGCGYEMRPGETPLQCLRRMEKERTFR